MLYGISEFNLINEPLAIRQQILTALDFSPDAKKGNGMLTTQSFPPEAGITNRYTSLLHVLWVEQMTPPGFPLQPEFQAIVQTMRSLLPEFDAVGQKTETSPMRRARHGHPLKSHLAGFHAPFKLRTTGQRA